MASTAAEQVERKIASVTSNPNPDIKAAVASRINSQSDASPSPSLNSKDFIFSVAAKVASQPLQNYDLNVWGVLTAISSHARKRRQGINILLSSDEHCLGRLPCHASYQVESTAISGNHCKIYRKPVTGGDGDNTSSSDVFVEDTSTNGTFLNWERLEKNGPAVRVQHGDIISLAVPPDHEKAFAFVYREILGNNAALSCINRKRKAEDVTSEIKRQKGIGIGGPNPISLDDFKSLQRSNTELRKQLEAQVLTIDTLRNESRSIVEHHESEIKQIKESTAKSFHNELIELRDLLDAKQKELAQVNKLSAEQKNSIDELGERVNASLQSLSEANEIVKSQKASIAELKTGLDEERDQRREERETATAELKAAIHRCQIEAQEELKRFSDAAMRHEREQQEVINRMKDSEKERSVQVETLMSKLEDTRQKLVYSDNRNRQLESQVSEEQLASANAQKKIEELDLEIKRLQKDLDSEKQAAREEAWAKVSALELEISAAVRDLDVERQRHRGARERIMLRETQMRAFYSTTEEISALFAKQQEQLKTMQRTLEDEDTCDNTSQDIDLNPITRSPNRANTQEDRRATYHSNCAARTSLSTSGKRSTRNEVLDTSCEDADATQKHDCEIMSQEGQNTQEAEYTSSENFVKGVFGSDIEGVGTAPTLGTDPVGTEQVNETQSPGNDYERSDQLRNSIILASDTMQIGCETQVHESVQNQDDGAVILLRNPNDRRDTQDTEGVGTVRTSDLLASEVAGSWAHSTAPSVHGENETERGRMDEESQTQRIKEVTLVHDSAGQVGESQTKPTRSGIMVTMEDDAERGVVNEPVGVIDQLKIKHATGSDSETESCSESDDDHEKEKHSPVFDSDTEGSDVNDDKGSHSSEPDSEGSHEADGDLKQVDTMDEDDKAT
ncbi:PREDICTED: intracellular protein transport protein USO1-like isoform X2 [Camelina sativa]|uniref:Intracellular protein transport protein USO1-like isoform X1 n=1 Tax=Camelina sativa TaxID=90675 RepID=A0ABM1RNQ0_CAMSA|nr:PREDICTED: intracellular protein transport protein USO1-like isoform X1 [Camelina sativa]XP_019100638.1 PREDICTED: intracellular protein transport protein USO1-like isoform X2 [Camelina sativa]